MSDTNEVAPVQFGASATVTEASVPPVEPESPEVEDQETEPETPVDPKHNHQSILIGLLTDLEGMLNMAKSEIHTVVSRWKAEFDNL